jgi:hypothetical protein
MEFGGPGFGCIHPGPSATRRPLPGSRRRSGRLAGSTGFASSTNSNDERQPLHTSGSCAAGPEHLHPRPLLPPPRGVDDASGLSKPSRFLTDEVESLCELVQPTESPPPLVGAQVHEQVTVVVDALWR